MENDVKKNEGIVFIEFEGMKLPKSYEQLVQIAEQSEQETASILKREMYLHSEGECSCYYCNTVCLAGAFLMKRGSSYDMVKAIERLKKNPVAVSCYTNFEIPVYDLEDEEQAMMCGLHQSGAFHSCYLSSYADIEKNMKFMSEIAEVEFDKDKVYAKLCEKYSELTPYAIAQAMGLEKAETFRTFENYE